MDIKEIYRLEKELDVYKDSPIDEFHFSNEYVKWLESKIKNNLKINN